MGDVEIFHLTISTIPIVASISGMFIAYQLGRYHARTEL